MTWLGYLNFGVLQWLFIRLERTVDCNDHSKHIAWGIIGPIIPLTGWWNRYIWLTPKGWRLGR